METWVGPLTPASSWARIRLTGGPFDGEDAGYVPPDTAAPVQVVWSSWTPWGFDAWLYEWHGEVTTAAGHTDALVYRATRRRLAADEIPPVLAADSDLWADGAMLLHRPPGQ